MTSSPDDEVLNIRTTAEDIKAAQIMGATGPELMLAVINDALDRAGKPRKGRIVTLKQGGFVVEYEGNTVEE